MQKDQFPARGPLSSAREWFAITPDDDVDLPQVPRGVWVGGAGNVAVVGLSGSAVLEGVTAGTLLPIAPTRVLLAGTTATKLVGLV